MRPLNTLILSTSISLLMLMQPIQAQSNVVTEQANLSSYNIDEKPTAQAQWEVGEIILEDDHIYRVFLGITTQGNYIIQDFYKEDNTKRSDPFTVTNTNALVTPLGKPISDVEGSYITWNSNGNKTSEIMFSNGHRHGPFTAWYPNGQKFVQGQYENGMKQGLWVEWHENGQQRSEGQFKDDLSQGQWTWWAEDGSQEAQGVYENNIKQGVWIISSPYLPYSSKSMRVEYNPAGEIESMVAFAENDQQLMQIDVDTNSQKITFQLWQPNGSPLISAQIIPSPDGISAENTPIQSAQNEAEAYLYELMYGPDIAKLPPYKMTGTWLIWHLNGEKIFEANFPETADASWQEWDENGNPVEIDMEAFADATKSMISTINILLLTYK